MTTDAVWQLEVQGERRVARGTIHQPTGLLPREVTIDTLIRSGSLEAASTDTAPLPKGFVVLAPLGSQPVWASGVTFLESRYAREAESGNSDVYRNVYFAERPELFFKASPGDTVGPWAEVGIRADSHWDVPEPEFVLVVDPAGSIIGYSLGNDMSSRSIEGANPLYLPQAKVYEKSAAIGPCLLPVSAAPDIREISIAMRITRQGTEVFRGSAPMTSLKRTPLELVDWLFRSLVFVNGVVLMCGTAIVPPEQFTLLPGDVVEISGTGLGCLENTVRRVGREPEAGAERAVSHG